MNVLFFVLSLSVSLLAFDIVDKPILFGPEREALTKEYIQKHYGIKNPDIYITPKIIVIHYTAIDDLERSFRAFYPRILPGFRSDISAASALNVSAHFLVDRDGRVYRLMDERIMARHVIGLNLYAIGIENVGGAEGKEDLTPEQLRANIELVSYLLKKYPGIEYLIGHYEYTRFEKSHLWLEKDPGYRTVKKDPGERFMKSLRSAFSQLKCEP